ncbi:MAG: hypothetical protein V4858_04865 [Pseudomonadota bacterium]
MRTFGLTLLTLAYPVLVYFGLGQQIEPRWLALILVAIALLRAAFGRERVWLVAAGGALVLAAFSFWGNQAMPLKLYPVLVSVTLLCVFSISLVYPPTVIERLARLHEPQLPPSGIAYTRRVTQVWCGFFIFNGSISLLTALFASDAVWALYNGMISYVLMGVLFVGEWLVRKRVKAKAAHA